MGGVPEGKVVAKLSHTQGNYTLQRSPLHTCRCSKINKIAERIATCMYTLKPIEVTHVRHGNIPGLSVGHVDGAPPGIKILYSCKILPVHTKKNHMSLLTHTCGGREPLSQVYTCKHYLSHLLGKWVLYLQLKL